MAIELDTVLKLEVTSQDRGFNQAATLTAVHHVPTDSGAILPEGTEVQYTDFDLGLTFFGRIVDVDRSFADGEGVTYACADAWRTLAKEPAEISGSTRIEAKEGASSVDILTEILGDFISRFPAILPGGVDLTDLDDVELPDLDKGGETIDTWINDVLGYTEDAVAWIDPNAGSPKLIVKRYADQASQPLDVGAFDIKTITPGAASPLLRTGSAGKSLNKKYKRIKLQGCGTFTRYVDRLLEGVAIAIDLDKAQWTFRYNVPEDFATPRFIDADGECREFTEVKISVGWQGSNPATFRLPNQHIHIDEVTGQNFFLIEVHVRGVFFELPPSLPFLAAWFTYTGYNGGFNVEKINPSALMDGEGTYLEQHEGYYAYIDGAQSIDFTAEATALVDRLYERHANAPDTAGDIGIHIKGTTPVDLGKSFGNPAPIAGSRIRSLSYDFPARLITANCSDEPLRDESRTLRQKGKQTRTEGNNWYAREVEEVSCFCGGDIVVDETGTSRRPSSPSATAKKYNCVQGFCDEVANGQYDDEQCNGDCDQPEGGWKFAPCAGCVPGDQFDWGAYDTEALCDAANPDPTGGEDCGGSSAGSAPDVVSTDLRSGKDWTCDGCSTGLGGETFVGFVKKVEVDASGKVKKVTCETCEISTGGDHSHDICDSGGFTGVITFVSAVSVGCCSLGSSGTAPISLGFGSLNVSCGLILP